ncbi:hypothetical protein Lal_00049295 [Lupinus albus]|nr:hypothetical protein Lal_00049295 [Lupinus albus]
MVSHILRRDPTYPKQVSKGRRELESRVLPLLKLLDEYQGSLLLKMLSSLTSIQFLTLKCVWGSLFNVTASGSRLSEPILAHARKSRPFQKLKSDPLVQARDSRSSDNFTASTGSKMPFLAQARQLSIRQATLAQARQFLLKREPFTKNIITSALSYDELFPVSQCNSAKEMWDTIQVTHEGISEVKHARLNALTQDYELFRMFPNEFIGDMQKRFTHIVNHLVALDKTFSKGELTNKPKVTAIMESKDLDSMALATLFGKIQ